MTALTTIFSATTSSPTRWRDHHDETGSILGAVGVSGDVSEPDEICPVAVEGR